MKNNEQWTIYYNPKCGTCRKTLALLNDNGIKPVIVEYLKHPLTETTINQLLALLKAQPLDIIRAKEEEFDALRLGDGAKTKAQLVKAISQNPILLQRPIVVRGNSAAIVARPPEKVLELL